LPYKNGQYTVSQKSFFIAFLVLALMGAGAGTWKWIRDKDAEKDKKPELVKVFHANELTQPKLQALSGRVDMSGVLQATESATLRAKTTGTLLRLHVSEGSVVRAGQLLAEIDTVDLKTRVLEREAATQAAKQAFQLAQVQHKANVDLAQKGFISDTALSSSLSSVASAQAQLKAAESLSVALQKQIAEAVVTAPFDGVVSKRSALVGEKLSVEQEILSLVNPHKLELKAVVDAAAGQHLKPGQALRVKLEGLDQEVPAVIVRLSPGNDTGSRGLPVFLRLGHLPAPLLAQVRPGLLGQASWVYALSAQGLTVPVTAVQNESGKTIVWVITHGVLNRRSVTPGVKDADGLRVYVLEGLGPEESILALRFEGLKDGAKVEVKP